VLPAILPQLSLDVEINGLPSRIDFHTASEHEDFFETLMIEVGHGIHRQNPFPARTFPRHKITKWDFGNVCVSRLLVGPFVFLEWHDDCPIHRGHVWFK
jgi:hypothetical protein